MPQTRASELIHNSVDLPSYEVYGLGRNNLLPSYVYTLRDSLHSRRDLSDLKLPHQTFDMVAL